ncbi:MAG TPA: chemotaxis protein CheW [Candidatus Polarisedimenticolia bacterium]|jgi:hypothetical protein
MEKDSERWFMLTACGLQVSLPAAAVRQILPHTGVIPVPLARPGVAGVVTRDGRAIPVYALADLLGATATGAAVAAGAIVVVEQDGALVGLLAERTEPARGRPPDGAGILDGVTLLSRAGIFDDGFGDQQAARAAEGAL